MYPVILTIKGENRSKKKEEIHLEDVSRIVNLNLRLRAII